MKINSRKHVSYSWEQTLRIDEQVQKLETVGQARKDMYSTMFIVAAASGLRIGELLALCSDDIDFDGSTIRVDESVDRLGQIGPCKNVAAYRTVVLADNRGQYAMQKLKQFIKQDGLVFRSKRGGPLVENTILVQGLHPAIKKLGFSQGWHACVSSRLQSSLGTVTNIASSDSSADGTRIGKHDCALHRRNSD